jgi:hypothetical protein
MKQVSDKHKKIIGRILWTACFIDEDDLEKIKKTDPSIQKSCKKILAPIIDLIEYIFKTMDHNLLMPVVEENCSEYVNNFLSSEDEQKPTPENFANIITACEQTGIRLQKAWTRYTEKQTIEFVIDTLRLLETIERDKIEEGMKQKKLFRDIEDFISEK